ncbi:MAG: reductive dehalogenase, partial [Deltaproteobacteria bacterium]|nr:reductive dehalogenase [Deltaproteobacteria bacterium]
VGICKIDRRWLYSHTYDEEAEKGDGNESPGTAKSVPQYVPEEIQWAVVMLFEMDYHVLSYYPTLCSHSVSSLGYSRMAVTNQFLSTFIRYLGFKAIDCTTNQVGLNIPMAMQAGLGDLGRSGLLISPKYGPRVRISKVLTDLPLVPDSPVDFGVTEFCERCEICAERCPSQSIKYGPRTTEPNNASNIEGVLKWPANAETCRIYWARMKQGCSVCIGCCPFNKPDNLFHRAVRWLTDHARFADPFYIRMDKLLGYGTPKPADSFWEEWRPKPGSG